MSHHSRRRRVLGKPVGIAGRVLYALTGIGAIIAAVTIGWLGFEWNAMLPGVAFGIGCALALLAFALAARWLYIAITARRHVDDHDARGRGTL